MRETFDERLRAELLTRGWRVQPDLVDAFKRATGRRISKQALSKVVNGGTPQPKHSTIVGICAALGVNEAWLMKGEEPKRGALLEARVREEVFAPGYWGGAADFEPDTRKLPSPETVRVSQREISPNYVRLPLLNMEGDMGPGVHNDGFYEVVEYLDVAEWWARQKLPSNLSRIKVISARGDSMAGLINHGDVVFVDDSVKAYDGEGIYVFNFQGRALIKRLAPNLRTGNLQILSNNAAAYPPEEILPGEIDELHIAGRVAAWWTLRHH